MYPRSQDTVAEVIGRNTVLRKTVQVHKRKRRKIDSSQSKVNHGQWHPDDDYLLICSVLHLMNIHSVYCGVKFSKSYQEKDIEKRWKELLFNDGRSTIALEAIRKISLYDKDHLDEKIPFNDAENAKLSKISYNDVYPSQSGIFSSNPSMEPFKQLLKEDRYSTFYRNRTCEHLFKAWTVLRKHINESVRLGGNPKRFEDVDLLIRRTADTPVSSCSTGDLSTDYKSFQRMFNQKQYRQSIPAAADQSVFGGGTLPSISGRMLVPSRPLSTRSSSTEGVADQQLIAEISQSDKTNRRRLFRQLRMVGEEARRWTCVVEAVTERPIIDRQGKNALATLTGTRSRFLIKEREATFGRRSTVVKPDIDLSCEGPVMQISRLQGCIRLDEADGQFIVANWGRQPIYVDGAVVLTREELCLRNDSMITVCGLTFRFNDHRVPAGDDTDLLTEEMLGGGQVYHVDGSSTTLPVSKTSVDQTRRKQILK